VYCQLVYLRGCHPGRIRHALSELPETLDETYERTLREINKADWELAHRLLQCVTVASRPLRVDELAEFLAFDFQEGPIPKFQEGWRLDDPLDAVLSTCSTLLSLVTVDGSPVIQFSHFSVKEFLTSTRLSKADDENLLRYFVSATPAHTLVAQACLGILLHLDMTITRDCLKKYPLAEYAAQHWVDHARFKDVSQYAEDGMKQLFDPRAPHLAIWVWICDPRNPSMDKDRAERPSQPGTTPLHFAAVCGLHGIVKFLAIDHLQDVHSRRFDDEWTPLHVASAYGHVEVARALIEHGADVSTRAIDKLTSLHVASGRGHIDVVRFLVEHGADAIACDKGGKTPLHVATRWGHMDVTLFLIEQGTNPTIHDYGGGTPLHDASTYGYVELTKLLIDRGANVSAPATNLRTPLHEASTFGHVELARILVERGAAMDVHANDGRTPLHLASSYGYMDIARILVEHGADTTTRADDGQSPLHVAASYGNLEISRILVEHGADVAARDLKGRTPLHGAASMHVARFLVEHGADATALDGNGWTAADAAAWAGHLAVTAFLDEHGRRLAAQDGDSGTPSHEASGEKGEHDTCATGPANEPTPFHVASEEGVMEIPRIVIEYVADKTSPAVDDGGTPSKAEVAPSVDEHDTDMTTAPLAPGSRSYYYVLVFCLFFGIYVQFRHVDSI
jgi:ankyrin repeat protein